MRQLGGVDQPAMVDAAASALARGSMRVIAQPRVELAILDVLAPSTRRVLERHLRASEPVYAGTVTPAQVLAEGRSRTARN